MAVNANPTELLKLVDAPASYEPTNDEIELIHNVVNFTQEAERSRDRFVRIWELIRNFIRGEQNLYQSETGELVRIVERNNRRLISINNQMKLAAKALLAKLTKHIPEYAVDPANGDQDQVQAALAGTEFLTFFREKEDFAFKYIMAMNDVAETGVGHLVLRWDPDAGDRKLICPVCQYIEDTIDNIDQPCQACGIEAQMKEEQFQAETAQAEQHAAATAQAAQMAAMGDPQAQQLHAQLQQTRPPVPQEPQHQIGTMEEFREGDVTCCYLNPREFLPEPGCTEMKHMRKWAERQVLPVTTVRDRHPHLADVIDRKRGLYNFNSVKVIRSTRQGEYNYDEYNEHCVLTIYQERPSAMYPKGRWIEIVNDEILADYREEHPLWFIERPSVFTFHWDKENDTFYSQPFGEHAWHRQKELNENETQQRENAELMANGKVLVAQNSGVRPDELTAKTGQVVMYNPGLPAPQPLRLGELSPDVYNRGGILKGSILEHAAVSAAEQGAMAGDASGRALAIVQAEADQQLGPMLKRTYSEVSELMKGALQTALRKYTLDRQFHVVGDQGLQVFTLAEMKLASGQGIRVVPEDGLSKNQQLRLNSLMDLANLGMFSNPMTGMFDQARFAKAAKLRIPGMTYDSTSSEQTYAHSLLRRIENGDFEIQPLPWDDPIAIGTVLKGWLATKGRNPKTDPMVTQYVYQLFVYYMQFAMYQQQGMGAPPTPPSGGSGQPSRSAQGAGPGAGAQAQSGSIAGQAASNVRAADQAAEGQARARTMPREG